ncbi:PHD and RING finger domain-containing protein 1 [Madurella mycetomatis]|uniref:PHD and RING finger domain-containing protein 1 n=1 Tax=Madurella mycetomatis TaxID=100816 RepID=A0A175WK43_9PEZI|nr:PHD and RING finger domain-containing protein 1 [Madurella mycetomatis]
MADQCIICLEPLDVETNTTPLSPAVHELVEELKSQHKRLAIEDPDALVSINQKHASAPFNHDHIATIPVCGHTLHDGCLREWSEKANSCPICRQTFHLVTVYEKVGGKYLLTRRVEDKKQVPEFDPRALVDEIAQEPELPSNPCPVCNSADHEEVLLLCDGCDSAYHTYCIGLDSVPVGPWFCMECVHAFGPELSLQPETADGQDGVLRQRYYFPRTQASIRRAMQRDRSDEWHGAWGRITGRVWDALELDLDYQDDEDSAVFEGLRRSRQLRERERLEHERWQQRLNIASRLGARDVFANNIPSLVALPEIEPPQASEEQLAWGALEKARGEEDRKRRAPSPDPQEEPHHEPERKLKRPRTRRLPTQPCESSSAARDPGPSDRQDLERSPPRSRPSRLTEEAPSFLSSLLKEVENSTPSDEERLRNIYVPLANNEISPVTSPSPSHGSTTPLSSHIEPRYHRINIPYSPTRGSSPASAKHSRSSSPSLQAQRADLSSPENSDSEHRGRSRHYHRHHHGALELRQPQPRRTPHAVLQRSQHTSPARNPLPYEMKQSINKIVRTALTPHWRSSQLTAEQYETINRDISRKIYEEVKDPATVSEDTKQSWERIASQEVARAVASLKA